MMDLLLLFVPFFALVLMGWGAARGGVLPLVGIGAMNSFVLYFGLSAMVFRLSASGALHQSGLLGLLLAYGVGGTVIAVLSLAWFARSGLTRRDGGLAALTTAFPNTGFLGLPLLTGLLGAQAAGPVAATLIVDVLLLSSLCLAWAHSAPSDPHHASEERRAVLASLKGALRNPLLWSMALGMAAAETHLVLPHAVDEVLRLLAQSATPVALFTLGAVLARSQLARALAAGKGDDEVDDAEDHAEDHAEDARAAAKAGGASWGRQVPQGPRRAAPAVWLPTVLKLGLHPALVWGTGQLLASQFGMSVPASGLLVLTMAAALPSASNVSMLAEREGADTGLVARIILWTTAASLLTLAVWAHLLGVKPGA
ncbi:MAG TPA: AEC family transporter [Candidatus Aquabacterium excrementipullorum]|nr:AEC family transporter [Candidatus Aquabacterium excrementipullorum]